MQLKVNIARKQPMLDAATGKSVWGSLGKDGILPSSPLYSTLLPRVLRVKVCARQLIENCQAVCRRGGKGRGGE